MSEARNFEDDLRNSNNPKLREDWVRIFKLRFGEDIEIIWKDDKETQKGFGTDITIKTNKGRRYSIELKGRKNSCIGKDYIMEIKNHVYDKEDKENRTCLNSYDGWIYTTTAEYIFHATLDQKGESIIECICYSLIPFKTPLWKSEFEKYETFFLPTRFYDGRFQWTINKLIPKEVIKKDALEFWEWKKENGNN